ncbi:MULTISPECIES: histidinol-phosphatase HisJ family protein [Fusobacterium]|uniref:histidinol-phosphatase HisJ family protein n=1 Tax=Fusobacterium TaxID=848 RepID=UPI0014778881|nr:MULTISPECIES: histidinol-phosphatase HisJ family protein [Fusobacterium]NME36619.1 histidinol-phosphatase HisJ family protein [Fusobacterium sp. FSA-380-WT-3A]
MFYSDYHIHSRFSGDSNEDLIKIIEKSTELGLEEIAITDHLEHGMEDLSSAWNINLDEYAKEILKLKEIYKDKIKIKFGIEAGIQPHTLDFYNEKISKYPLDFVIASTHGINSIDLAFGILQAGKTRDEMQEFYFKTVLENVKKFQNYCVYGHIDFITRYGGPKFRGMDIGKHMEVIDEILKEIISRGKGIEINTSGFRYGEDRVYPDFPILKRYFELGGEILTIGSDSHQKEYITKDFKIAYEMLEKLDVKYITSFEKMNPSFIKIR